MADSSKSMLSVNGGDDLDKLIEECQASSNNLLRKLQEIKEEAETLVVVINEVKENQRQAGNTIRALNEKVIKIQKTLDAITH